MHILYIQKYYTKIIITQYLTYNLILIKLKDGIRWKANGNRSA